MGRKATSIMSFNVEEDEVQQPRSSSPKRASPSAAKARSAGKSAAPGSAKPAAGRRSSTRTASPGEGAGNYIVNPDTGRTLQVRVQDKKNNTMKYNPLYTKLTATHDVNRLHRYKTKAEADEAAQALRDQRRDRDQTASGEKKVTQYYFNKTTHRVVSSKGSATEGPFDSPEEARMWAYEHGPDGKAEPKKGYLKKKPTATKRVDAKGEENVLWFYTVDQRKDGTEFNNFKMWKNRKGELTTIAKTLISMKLPEPELFTTAQRMEISAEKSSSSRPGRKIVGPGDLDAAVEGARRRGAEQKSIDKILDNRDRSDAQKVASLKLLANGNNRAGMGAICLKRVALVDGPVLADGTKTLVPAKPSKEVGQASVILKTDGSLGSAAVDFAKEYLNAIGSKALKSKLTDADVKKHIKAAVRAGFFVQQFGTTAKSKCQNHNQAIRVSEW